MTGLEHYVGQVLDEKYRLERLLGQGGMGAVYLATHLGTERFVALKLIAPDFMRNEEFVERFKREARAAGRLRHPNVVDVTDFGFARTGVERVAYLVMEYLDGCTLGDVLAEEQRLPLEWVVDILEQVSSAVHEAHQPPHVGTNSETDTLLYTGSHGDQRIEQNERDHAHADAHGNDAHLSGETDDTQLFVAAPTGGRAQATAAVGATVQGAGLTRVGSIMGTPLYMSPEQCRGERLDARSDIYSLGVIAFQMLTGAPPFSSDMMTVMREHMESAPPPLRERNRK